MIHTFYERPIENTTGIPVQAQSYFGSAAQAENGGLATQSEYGEQAPDEWDAVRVTATLDSYYVHITDYNAGVVDVLSEPPAGLTHLIQLETQHQERVTMPDERLHMLEVCVDYADRRSNAAGNAFQVQTDAMVSALAHTYGRKAQNPYYSSKQKKLLYARATEYRNRIGQPDPERSEAYLRRVGEASGVVAVAAA